MGTRNAPAIAKSSMSVVPRIWASIFASVPREIAHPAISHFAASASCVQPRFDRSCRTVSPTAFLGNDCSITELDRRQKRGLKCSVMEQDHTETSLMNSLPVIRKYSMTREPLKRMDQMK